MFANSRDCDCVQEIDPTETKKGNLWIGNFRPSDDLHFLKKNNIDHVLTAMPKICADRPQYVEHNIKHMIADSEDAPGCNISVYFEKAYDFIEDAMNNGNILVHCGAGISRSTTMALAWWIKKHKQPMSVGLELFRKKRPICTPNTGFMKQLKEWEEKWVAKD